MAIRLASNCTNCSNLKNDSLCTLHNIPVTGRHTCDSFMMRAEVKNVMQCLTCIRYHKEDCPHPKQAAPEMLCADWAPKATA
ncbi:hypothetical protein E7Z59_14775 [Robertkochia marina]|uniref:Uncharacterized protein n=1 Tax=Robertkochia marina TaxID=1227945 RepID=A0A4S3LY34_9FLAO|nr:hypothetical protein [Robertkochia marina]THD65841.1 hypothetical protein E7Z59_14775 [Robertkochia marina]TRZ41344.1 hypothetical protein D3A96_13385 [Robertkochia marina]